MVADGGFTPRETNIEKMAGREIDFSGEHALGKCAQRHQRTAASSAQRVYLSTRDESLRLPRGASCCIPKGGTEKDRGCCTVPLQGRLARPGSAVRSSRCSAVRAIASAAVRWRGPRRARRWRRSEKRWPAKKRKPSIVVEEESWNFATLGSKSKLGLRQFHVRGLSSQGTELLWAVPHLITCNNGFGCENPSRPQLEGSSKTRTYIAATRVLISSPISRLRAFRAASFFTAST